MHPARWVMLRWVLRELTLVPGYHVAAADMDDISLHDGASRATPLVAAEHDSRKGERAPLGPDR